MKASGIAYANAVFVAGMVLVMVMAPAVWCYFGTPGRDFASGLQIAGMILGITAALVIVRESGTA